MPPSTWTLRTTRPSQGLQLRRISLPRSTHSQSFPPTRTSPLAVLGISLTDPLPVFLYTTVAAYKPDNSYYDAPYQGGEGEIVLRRSDFAPDAKVLGHEFGHYAADAAGILNPVGGFHMFSYNQRLLTTPTSVLGLTALDQELSFNEGFADWFAVAGASYEADTMLNVLPGFGVTQVHVFRGHNLDEDGGAGEDTDASVARILWGLDAPGGEYGFGPAAVFELAEDSGGTLYGLWQELTDPASQCYVNPDVLAGTFADENVAPDADTATVVGDTATFDFWLPVTTAYNQFSAGVTFDQVTVEVRGDGGAVAFSRTFAGLNDGVGERDITAPLSELNYDAKKGDQGGWVEVQWKVSGAEWQNDAMLLGESTGPFTWDVVGTTNVSDSSPSEQTVYPSEQEPFPFTAPYAMVASFTATSPGNNTLDLSYDIVTPNTGPGGTLTSLTVTLYASTSGLFDDPNTDPNMVQIAPVYNVTDPNLLSGSGEKTYSMDASLVGYGNYANAFAQFAGSHSDWFLLAEIDDGSGSGPQWVRLQQGAFLDGAVYVMGDASLDGPTPDTTTTDTLLLSTSDQGITVTDSSAEWSRTFSYAANARVFPHGDSLDASGIDNYNMDLAVVCGQGDETITGATAANETFVAGPGNDTFDVGVGFDEADTIVFAGDSPLGSDTVSVKNGSGSVGLDFSGLGEGINLDLGNSGQQTLNGLLSLKASPRGGNPGREGTKYYHGAYSLAC